MTQDRTARDLLAVALDLDSLEKAETLVGHLDGVPGWLKVGSELFTAAGPKAIALAAGQARVFLDMKFHDIPNTVARAVAAATLQGVGMMTLHTGGGLAMMRAAREAAQEAAAKGGMRPPLLVGVTVLTSMDEAGLKEVGVEGELTDQVARLVELALAAELDGVVASAQEAPAIRAQVGPGFRIVTPGIRRATGEVGDQVRTATAAQAVEGGSDLLVIGRPVVQAADPAASAREFLEEIQSVLDALGP